MQQRPSFGFIQDPHGKDSEGKNEALGQYKTMLWLLPPYDQYLIFQNLQGKVALQDLQRVRSMSRKFLKKVLSPKMALKIQ